MDRSSFVGSNKPKPESKPRLKAAEFLLSRRRRRKNLAKPKISRNFRNASRNLWLSRLTCLVSYSTVAGSDVRMARPLSSSRFV